MQTYQINRNKLRRRRIMQDVVNDIVVLESALVAFNEGASDEKYAAVWNLEKLLLEKRQMLQQFEDDMEEEFLIDEY